MNLAEFLLARIADDEAAAGVMLENQRWLSDCGEIHDATIEVWWPGTDGPRPPDWIIDSKRLLAECDAKRRIVEEHKPWSGGYECPTCADGAGLDHGEAVVDRLRAPCPTLRLLALPYADHPAFDEAWRP